LSKKSIKTETASLNQAVILDLETRRIQYGVIEGRSECVSEVGIRKNFAICIDDTSPNALRIPNRSRDVIYPWFSLTFYNFYRDTKPKGGYPLRFVGSIHRDRLETTGAPGLDDAFLLA
jgi:hypothetical protein